MTVSRERLPNRRGCETIDIEHRNGVGAGSHYTATLGYYDDGRIGEIFLNSTKVGTDVDIAVRDAAIAASFALQHGVSVEDLRVAMTRDANGRPEGVLGTVLETVAPSRRADGGANIKTKHIFPEQSP